jgi:hypothetical protein
LGYSFLQIIFNDTHIYLRFVRLLKAFSSITDMLLFCSCLLIVNKYLYSTNGLLLYFSDTYLIILNRVRSATSLNYLWYVCVFDKYLWIIGLLICLSLFWIILELWYSLSGFEYYVRSNILNTDSSRLWENKLSSTERSDLGDDSWRSVFVLCPRDILFSVRLRFMDSDYLFGIFKLVLHIKTKELLAQA